MNRRIFRVIFVRQISFRPTFVHRHTKYWRRHCVLLYMIFYNHSFLGIEELNGEVEKLQKVKPAFFIGFHPGKCYCI